MLMVTASFAVSAAASEGAFISIGVACQVQVAPRLSRKALLEGGSGTVVAEVQIVAGQVSEVTIVSGPDVFRESVITAIKQYKCDENVSAVARQEFKFIIEGAGPAFTLPKRGGPFEMTLQSVIGGAKSSVALGKSYGELTLEEKAVVQTDYPELPAGDEPPFPLGGMKTIFDPIGQGLGYLLKGEGVYEGRLEVDEQGVPLSVSTMQSPNNKTTDFIARVAMLTRFKPSLCNGNPCRGTFKFRAKLKVE